MKKTNAECDRIERLMKQVRPTGPSPQIKDRVTSAAMKVWGQAPRGVSWQIALRRLAISAAAAVLVVSLADAFSDSVTPQWYRAEPPMTNSESIDLNDLPATGYGALVRRLAASGFRPPEADGLTLHNYLGQLRDMLQEHQPSENGDPPASPSGRSRLVPASSPDKSWS